MSSESDSALHFLFIFFFFELLHPLSVALPSPSAIQYIVPHHFAVLTIKSCDIVPKTAANSASSWRLGGVGKTKQNMK